MKLILEAIKAMFRKAETSISQNSQKTSELSKRLDAAKSKIRAAQNTADAAQTKANAVQSAVNGKMDATNPSGTGHFSMGRKKNSTIGLNSHAEGNTTIASGPNSHAEGGGTTASGVNSHAEGNSTTASGKYSHAEGNNTTASGKDSHVQGKYNVIDSEEKYAHVVGNGTSYHNPSNAHTLDWHGVPWYQGRPQFGGNAQDDGSQTVMANGDMTIILTSSTEGSTKRFSISVDDSGTLSATELST